MQPDKTATATPTANDERVQMLRDELKTLQFPISNEEAAKKVGDKTIPFGADKRVSLEKVFRAMPQQKFENVDEAARVIDQNWSKVASQVGAAPGGAPPGP